MDRRIHLSESGIAAISFARQLQLMAKDMNFGQKMNSTEPSVIFILTLPPNR